MQGARRLSDVRIRDSIAAILGILLGLALLVLTYGDGLTFHVSLPGHGTTGLSRVQLLPQGSITDQASSPTRFRDDGTTIATDAAGRRVDDGHYSVVRRLGSNGTAAGQVNYGALYESDRHWDLFQAKQVGGWLTSYMNAAIDSGCVLESSWNVSAALDAHGWVQQRPNNQSDSAVSDTVKTFFNNIKSALALQDRVEDVVTARWQHSQAKTIAGVTYQPTHGYYDQSFSKSTIMAMDLDSPMEAGPQQSPPLGDSQHPIVKLRIWSDVTFLTYKKYCDDHSFAVADLQAIAHHSIANQQTVKIVEALLGKDKPAFASAKVLQGEDLAALLATPSGQGSVWLLTQHKAALGVRSITKARIWYDNGWHLIFVVGQPVSSAQSLRRDRLPWPENVHDGSIPLAESTRNAVAPKPVDVGTPDDSKNRGTSGTKFQSRIDLSPFPDDHQLQTWGWENPLRKQVNQDVGDTTRDNVFRSADVQASQKKVDNFWAVDEHITERVIDGETYYPTGAVYSNQYNARLIIAIANFGPADKGHLMTPEVTGDPYPYPDFSHWSDAVFVEFQDFMTKNGKSTKDLQALWQKEIINQDTLNVISRVCGTKRKLVPQWPGKTFAAGSDEFAALLATANGVGGAYLLGQHRDVLSHKYFTDVTVFYDGSAHLLWSIGTVPDDDLSKQLGDASKTPRDLQSLSVWPRASLDPLASSAEDLKKEALEAGKYLSGIQDKDVPELEQCNFPQSKFTSVDALNQYGWVLGRDVTTKPSTYQPIFQSAESMSLPNMGNWYRSKHSMQSHDGSGTYYPTGAIYWSFILRGLIGAINNKSPIYEGPKLIPPIDGVKDPFPPLSSWSDTVFLQYLDFCKGDSGCMHALQGVVRDSVVNKYTEKVARLMFGENGPGKWPGTVYMPGEDGFNIFMGVPNGKGVSYLLAQHREQLGWKVVDKIYVFSAPFRVDLNIFYHISDHGASSGQSGGAAASKPEQRNVDTAESRAAEQEMFEKGFSEGLRTRSGLRAVGSLAKRVESVIEKLLGGCRLWEGCRSGSTLG